MRFRIILSVMVISGFCHAGPRPGGHCPSPGRHCHPPAHRPPPHHPHHDYWSPGGRYFWPGFVGGVVGGAVANAVVQQPVVVQQSLTVVTQPVVIQQPATQNVWVEGRYVDQVQANGAVIRIWQPGHYEQHVITVR